MKITVITPTIRREGLDVVRKCLKNQSFTDFEWLIGSPFDPDIKDALWVEDDFIGGYPRGKENSALCPGYSLNRIYNKLTKQASGDLLVSIQDNIWFAPDCLERFWQHFQTNPSALVTGVGDQYNEKQDQDGPYFIAKVWEDPRKAMRVSCGVVEPINWEANFASIPIAILWKIGGFDEQLDLGCGCDNLSVAERAVDAGYPVILDKSLECRAYSHVKDPILASEGHNMNGGYVKRKEELLNAHIWPHLHYL